MESSRKLVEIAGQEIRPEVSLAPKAEARNEHPGVREMVVPVVPSVVSPGGQVVQKILEHVLALGASKS